MAFLGAAHRLIIMNLLQKKYIVSFIDSVKNNLISQNIFLPKHHLSLSSQSFRSVSWDLHQC